MPLLVDRDVQAALPDRRAIHHELVAEPGQAEEDEGEPVKKRKAAQAVPPCAAVNPQARNSGSAGLSPDPAHRRSRLAHRAAPDGSQSCSDERARSACRCPTRQPRSSGSTPAPRMAVQPGTIPAWCAFETMANHGISTSPERDDLSYGVRAMDSD